MIHVYPGTAEYPLLAMLLICRRVESGKNCLRCFLDAEKFLHLALSVPESFKGLSSHKKKMCIAEENGVQWRKFCEAKCFILLEWNVDIWILQRRNPRRHVVSQRQSNLSFRWMRSESPHVSALRSKKKVSACDSCAFQ